MLSVAYRLIMPISSAGIPISKRCRNELAWRSDIGFTLNSRPEKVKTEAILNSLRFAGLLLPLSLSGSAGKIKLRHYHKGIFFLIQKFV